MEGQVEYMCVYGAAGGGMHLRTDGRHGARGPTHIAVKCPTGPVVRHTGGPGGGAAFARQSHGLGNIP